MSKSSDKRAIHGYVSGEIRTKFEAYQRRIGLTSLSALLSILILRENNQRRLDKASAPSPAQAKGARRPKVSAYLHPSHADAFRVRARLLGRSASDCAAALVERELEECWLEVALKGGAT